MEVRQYLRILWHRRWLIALAFAAAAASTIYLSQRQTPLYRSQASVFIGPRTVDSNNAAAAFQELLFSREFVSSFSDMLTRLPLAERAIDKLDVEMTPAELVGKIATHIVPDTRIIELEVTDTDGTRAQRLANALVLTFVQDVERNFGTGSPVNVLERANAGSRISPRPLRDGALGAILGLMLGVGIALLLENLDTTLRTREQAEAALEPLPILAAIPRFEVNGGAGSVLLETHPKAPATEAFRILRTGIQFLGVDRPVRSLIVTSPYPEDGKTTVAVNLAAAMGAAGVRTVLVESDLRRPAVHTYFKLEQTPGVTDVLVGRANLDDVMHESRFPKISVIPAGPLPPNPSELLGSQRMVELLSTLTKRFDLVILDTPPTLPVTDSGVLAQHVDGVILVLRAGRTHRERAREALASLQRLGVRVVGAVFNGVDSADAGYYYYYHRYYGDRPRTNGNDVTETAQVSGGEGIESGATSRRSREPRKKGLSARAQTDNADVGASSGGGSSIIGKAILRALTDPPSRGRDSASGAQNGGDAPVPARSAAEGLSPDQPNGEIGKAQEPPR